MKKYLLYVPIALALVGMSSCSQDRDPKYHDPVPGSFVLNVPAMQDQEIILAEGNTLEFSCSQPDYGFAASATYSVDMALTEDFSSFYTLSPINANSTILTVPQSDVATGYCELVGVDSEETYTEKYPNGFPTSKIFFRANCQIGSYENSAITSNVVSYNYLKPYFAVAVPGSIYLVGSVNGWVEPAEGNAAFYSNWKLSEAGDAIGSKIYSGIFNIDAGDIYFRFYTELSGWGSDGELPSVGPFANDGTNLTVEFTDGEFTGKAVPGKGSWEVADWAGGEMTMVVNMSDMNNITVTFSAGAVEVFTPKYIFLMGSLQGWSSPATDHESAYMSYRLFNSKDAENIYTGTFDAPSGKLQYRFATQLDGEGDAAWDSPYQLGYQVDDNDTEFTFTNGVIETPYVSGKGNWAVELESACKVTFVVDMDAQTASCILEE